MLTILLIAVALPLVRCQNRAPKVPSPSPSTEPMLNTSDLYSSFWVKTVIQVRPDTGDDVYSSSFRLKMESKLAETYNLAIWIRANSRRRKRAVTYNNATIQMTNITREYFANPLDTDLIYYLVQYRNFSTITPAQETVSLMNLLSTEEVSKILGYPVTVKAEVYEPEPPPPPSNLWIIGAVIGGVIGLIILIWLILFIYCKCTRPPKGLVKTPRQTESSREQDASGRQSTGKLDAKALATLSTENEEQKGFKEQATSVRSPATAEKYIQVDSRHEDHGEHLYAQIMKVPKINGVDVSEITRKKKKRRTKPEAQAESEVNLQQSGTLTGAENPYSDGSLEPKDEKNEEMQRVEENDQSLKRPIHMPLHVGMASNRSKVLWDPYEAADVSAKILSTEDQVALSRTTHPKPKRQHSVDSVNSAAVPGVHKSPETIEMPWTTKRTLNALRDAGLIPSEDYTSVILDTRTFGPRPKSKTQESSADETTSNRRHRSSKSPYTRPGQPRPVWSVEDEPELENDIQEIGQTEAQGSKTSLKYSEDETDHSSRSNNRGISGHRRKKNQKNVLDIDHEEHSSNA